MGKLFRERCYLTRELGLDGVLFGLSPFESLRDPDLEQVRATAVTLGLQVEVGIGSIFHRHPMAEKGRRLLAEAGQDTAAGEAHTVIQHLEVARQLGSPILRCVAGKEPFGARASQT